MKHQPIIAAHAPNCGCPRCRHLRTPRRADGTTVFAIAAGIAGFVLIPGRVAIAYAASALGF